MKKANQTDSTLEISAKINQQGFDIKVFDNQKCYVKYPSDIFNKFPDKDFLIDNFVYARTRTLPLAKSRTLVYKTVKPYLKNFIDWGIKSDLGRIADISKMLTAKLIERFSNKDVLFENKTVNKQLKSFINLKSDKALLALSFGKDSLLSYGLGREIGLICETAIDLDRENYTARAWQQRMKIIKSFIQQEQQTLVGFRDNIDIIHSNKREIKHHIEELEDLNGMLAFTLELMPIAYQAKAKYLIFGNERNFNDFYYNHDGVKSYLSFDQSTGYTKRLNKLLNNLTNGNLQVISLVEPLYNLAEMKILYNRYPGLLAYVMSCYPKKESIDRWCKNCAICAEIFLYTTAVGGDPTKIGIKEKMFSRKDSRLYSLLAKKISRPYEKLSQIRDEQLLSFLLAYRNGWRGYLIDLFKTKYLPEAIKREKELRHKFFGIHQAVNMPLEYKAKILKIYQEELRGLN